MRKFACVCLVSACAADPPGGNATGSAGPYFEHAMFWNRDVSNEPKAANSDELIGAIAAAGGWGNQDHLRVDFSMDVLRADASAPRAFTPTDLFEVPDCDDMPVPVPATGNVEGESGYRCSAGGDCHLLVVD